MKKILVTGSSGLVGQALFKQLSFDDRYQVYYSNSKLHDLTKETVVKTMYENIKPDYVIHAAAKIGGVGGNHHHHGEYFYDNVLMNSYMIHYAYLNRVEKFIGFSSVCVFPDDIGLLSESNVHMGEPSQFNFAYAHAKRMMDIQISAYKKQYGIKNYLSIISTNVFGENDYYNIEYGHVLPSLIHKLYIALTTNASFTIWGDGSAVREFIYSQDLAKIVINLLSLENIPQRLVVSSPDEYSIMQIVEKLIKISNFTREVVYDKAKPNGQKRRPTDLKLLRNILPETTYTDVDIALYNSWTWFKNHYHIIRK